MAEKANNDPFLNPNSLLSDVHPALADLPAINTVGATTTNQAPPPPAATNLDPSQFGLIGGGAGLAASRMPMAAATPSVPVMAANANAAGSSATAQEMMADLVKRQLMHNEQLSSIQQAMQTTGQMHEQHVGNLANATQAAKQLNAMPPMPTPGDNWAVGSEAKGTVGGVTGSMGPGGESVAEASRNYRMQQGNKEFKGQGLKGDEGAKYRVNRYGIIEPNRDVPLTIPQEAAQKAYLDAQQRVAETEAKLKELIAEHDKLRKEGPYSRQHDEAVSRQKAKVAGLKKEAALLAEQASKEGVISKLGRVLGKAGPVMGGASAGYQLAEAINEGKRGDYIPAAIHGLSGLGSAAMLIPHGFTRGLGALATIPGVAYDAYTEYNKPAPLTTK